MKHDSTAYAAERPKWDTQDCSVRALAVATGLSYEQAGAIFAAFGRKLKQRTSIELSARLHEEKFKMRRIVIPAHEAELKYFLLFNPKGRYILHRKGHAFAVLDGVVHDWEGTRERAQIVRGWEITPETEEVVAKYKELLG